MTNDERMTNDENRMTKSGVRCSSFRLLHSFVIDHSSLLFGVYSSCQHGIYASPACCFALASSTPISFQYPGSGAMTVIGSYLIGCRNVRVRACRAMTLSRGNSAGGPKA